MMNPILTDLVSVMGNYVSNAVVGAIHRVSKRKREEIDDIDDGDSEISRQMHCTKRVKLMSTAKFIYKTLFEDGKSSDVKIKALGKEWNLHRLYLSQSPYFDSMFCGRWVESEADTIQIEVADPTVTVEALNTVLGSFYLDELVIQPKDVVSVLGAATLFQIEPVLEQCKSIMEKTVNAHTAMMYHQAAHRYGMMHIVEACFNWLCRNLLGCISELPAKLGEISVELMRELLASPKLSVTQTEFSIYILLKNWVFLKENPTWAGSAENCLEDATKYFKEESKNGVYFLDNEVHVSYVPVFKLLRLQHLVTHHVDVEMLVSDKLIPRSWLEPLYFLQWYQMIKVDQGIDRGPQNVSEEQFSKSCLRCGRVIQNDGNHVWRWTGFNFGLDLIFTFTERVIKCKRNHKIDSNFESSLSQQLKRNVMYKITVASLDESRRVNFAATSVLKTISLNKNEERVLMTIAKDAPINFPLYLNASLLVVTPLDDEIVATLIPPPIVVPRSQDEEDSECQDSDLATPPPEVIEH